MYDKVSKVATEFIDHEEILKSLDFALKHKSDKAYLTDIIDRASDMKGISHMQALALLECEDKDINDKIFALARRIKSEKYGKRVVMFAPLYLSNHCVNGCVYCPYHLKNKIIARKKLVGEDLVREVVALQDMGHKRLAIESGEHPTESPIEYILECIKTIYDIKHKNGAIRRVNVNIAGTTVENYRKLHDAGIGTYILFQETYNKENYQILHPTGPKSNYDYHTESMDRAMDGGIDDVGIGVLYGLEHYRYDFVGLLMHAEHLEATYGVGPHTMSVPRIRPASDISLKDFDNSISDELLVKIVAVLRIAVPYTGLIISTRESADVRARLLEVGVTQISGGSRTSVGGYAEGGESEDSTQFDVADNRTLDEVVCWLLESGHLPSFCTACYISGRTGYAFMDIVKGEGIANTCEINALVTLSEYLTDYASSSTHAVGIAYLERYIDKMQNAKLKESIQKKIKQVLAGVRDIRV